MEKKGKNSRRSFLAAAAKGALITVVSPSALAAAPTAGSMILPSSAKGANDRLRIAVLGVNGRGVTAGNYLAG